MKKAVFLPNQEITYIPSPHYGSRHLLPEPYWQGHEDTIACHDKAWQIACGNLRMPVPQSGFVSAFIDTAFNGNLFVWDSCFILMFGRTASRTIPFATKPSPCAALREPRRMKSRM